MWRTRINRGTGSSVSSCCDQSSQMSQKDTGGKGSPKVRRRNANYILSCLMFPRFCGKHVKLSSFVLHCVMFQRRCGVCGRPHSCRCSSNVEISRTLFHVEDPFQVWVHFIRYYWKYFILSSKKKTLLIMETFVTNWHLHLQTSVGKKRVKLSFPLAASAAAACSIVYKDFLAQLTRCSEQPNYRVKP